MNQELIINSINRTSDRDFEKYINTLTNKRIFLQPSNKKPIKHSSSSKYGKISNKIKSKTNKENLHDPVIVSTCTDHDEIVIEEPDVAYSFATISNTEMPSLNIAKVK